MPLVTPRLNEDKSKFISRCMSNPTMAAEYKQEVRAGICYGQWRRSKGIPIKNNLRQGSGGEVMSYNTGQLIAEGYNKDVAGKIAEFYADGEY